METTYTWEDAARGGTRMSLRNQGEPSGFSRVAAPVMARAMRSANRKDLERLKGLLEGSCGRRTRGFQIATHPSSGARCCRVACQTREVP
jgi:hypothetical protein